MKKQTSILDVKNRAALRTATKGTRTGGCLSKINSKTKNGNSYKKKVQIVLHVRVRCGKMMGSWSRQLVF